MTCEVNWPESDFVNICVIWTLKLDARPYCDAQKEDAGDEEGGDGSHLLHVVLVHRVHQEGTVDTLGLWSCVFHSCIHQFFTFYG